MTYRQTIIYLLLSVAAAAGLASGCGDPSSDATPQGEIEMLIRSGDLEAAEKEAKRSIEADPDDPHLRLLLGEIHLASGKGAAAFASFERAGALGLEATQLREPLVDSLILQGDFSRVLKLVPRTEQLSDIPPPLLLKRLDALLRIPLVLPHDLFSDTRQLLSRGDWSMPDKLEKLVTQGGVIPENASHVRRALAYWKCQSRPPVKSSPDDWPQWAPRDGSGRRVLTVGPGLELGAPSAAARIAGDGDIIDIEAGVYQGDVAVWRANGLWIRSKGGMVTLKSGGATAEDMAIWVVRGNDTLIEGIRFEGARATAGNGSGIRLLAPNLWLRHSEFHDNEAGLLTYNEPGGEVRVEHSIFTSNGAGDGQSHNVYVGRTDRLVFRFNYSAGTKGGHQLKSRALENFILYNRLADEVDGDSSYTIDLPEGGFALVVGNEIQQGPHTVNKHMISLGTELPDGRHHKFIFAYNTFYNGTLPASFIRDATGAGVALVNNAFAGAPAALDLRSTVRAGNAFDANLGLNDGHAGDYRLKGSAFFIESGEIMDEVDGIDIVPQYEYVHPASANRRQVVWRPDPGAHEFCGWPG
jgi:hypothetical protein